MTISLTLTFDSIADLHDYLDRTRGTVLGKIEPFDNPSAGVSFGEKAAVLAFPPSFTDPVPSFPTPFNPFASGASAPAPSTAVVAALPTAPEAPPVTSVPPPAAGVPPAPTPAPVAVVPAAPAAPASHAGIEVDADGLPWDARIHAGGRATNADGRWRQKRGLNDPALKARVEAELRQAMGAPAASVPVVPTPQAASIPTAPPVATSPAPTAAIPATPVAPLSALTIPPAPTATAPAAAPTPPAPVPTGPSAVGEPFPVFMARVGSMLVNGKLAQEQLNALLAECGLTSPAQLGVRPDLIPALAARIDAVAA